MTTRWLCLKCRATGAIRHKADESVWVVIDKLRASHWRTAGQQCDIVAKMRVTLVEPTNRRAR